MLFVQDPASVWVCQMLELFGYCGIGESGPFVQEGRIGLGGDIPVNTNGGQLSESYMWGWLHLCEAVRQLRGDCGDTPGGRCQVCPVLLNQGIREGGDVDPRHRGSGVTGRAIRRLLAAAAQLLGEGPVDDELAGPALMLPALRPTAGTSATLRLRCVPSAWAARSVGGRTPVSARSGATASTTAPSTRPSRAALPYNVALVELDSGPRLISNVLDVAAEDLRVGLRVIGKPIEVVPGRHLVYFTRDGEGHEGDDGS